MLYIEKEGLPNAINRKIIKLSKSEAWKNISEEDTAAIRNSFDNDFPKNEVKKILLHEQHGLCVGINNITMTKTKSIAARLSECRCRG